MIKCFDNESYYNDITMNDIVATAEKTLLRILLYVHLNVSLSCGFAMWTID